MNTSIQLQAKAERERRKRDWRGAMRRQGIENPDAVLENAASALFNRLQSLPQAQREAAESAMDRYDWGELERLLGRIQWFETRETADGGGNDGLDTAGASGNRTAFQEVLS